MIYIYMYAAIFKRKKEAHVEEGATKGTTALVC